MLVIFIQAISRSQWDHKDKVWYRCVWKSPTHLIAIFANNIFSLVHLYYKKMCVTSKTFWCFVAGSGTKSFENKFKSSAFKSKLQLAYQKGKPLLIIMLSENLLYSMRYCLEKYLIYSLVLSIIPIIIPLMKPEFPVRWKSCVYQTGFTKVPFVVCLVFHFYKINFAQISASGLQVIFEYHSM